MVGNKKRDNKNKNTFTLPKKNRYIKKSIVWIGKTKRALFVFIIWR